MKIIFFITAFVGFLLISILFVDSILRHRGGDGIGWLNKQTSIKNFTDKKDLIGISRAHDDDLPNG